MIESLPGMPKIGEKLLISGKIHTQQFSYKDKKRTSIQVIAKQMYVCDDRYGKIQVKTPNNVEMLAQICFDISNEETYSNFIIAVQNKLKYVKYCFDDNTPISTLLHLNKHTSFDFQKFRWNRCGSNGFCTDICIQ